MSDSNHLTITLDLDRRGATRESKAFRAEQKQVNADLLGDARALEAAQVAGAKQTAQERIKAAGAARDAMGRFVKQATDGAKEEIAARKRVKEASVDSFAATTVAIEGVKLGIGALRGLVDGLAQSYAKAGAKSIELARGFSQQREGLGQLASLMGRPADDALTLDIAKFNKKTGFKPEEGRAFLENLYNAGAQYKGTNISDGEFDDLAIQGGKLALAKGVDPAIVADLLGRQIGFKDYSQYGKGASEQVLADVNKAFAIGSSGIGNDSQLASETSKLAASSVNEDALRGVFTSVADAEKMVSVLTEGFPMGQAEAGGALLRAVRGFDKRKTGKFLKEAGVKPTDDPFEAVEKIGRHAEKLAKEGPEGTTVQDVIKKNIPDELGSRAINVVYNKGVVGGLLAKRDETGRQNASPETALGVLGSFEASPRGKSRAADADVALAEAERGAENSEVDILRRQATARLIRDKQIDTNSTNFADYLNHKASFGLIGDAEQKRIDDEVQRTLIARSPKGTAPGKISDLLNVSPLAREQELRERIGRIRAAGGDPLAERAGEDAQIGEQRQRWTLQNLFHAVVGEEPAPAAAAGGDMKETNQLLKQVVQNTATKTQSPKPLVGAPPARTR